MACDLLPKIFEDMKEDKSSIDVKGEIRSVLAQKGNVTREKKANIRVGSAQTPHVLVLALSNQTLTFTCEQSKLLGVLDKLYIIDSSAQNGS